MNFFERGLSTDDFESASVPPKKLGEWLHQAGIRIPKIFQPQGQEVLRMEEEGRPVLKEDTAEF